MKPTQEYLRTRFDYDPDNGELRWKAIPITRRADKTWNGRFAGRIAGTRIQGRHSYVGMDFNLHPAHHIIWMMETGEWPSEIDHIDRNPLNNRLGNLRSVTHGENMRNQLKHSNNTSGYKGVSWNKQRSKWDAQIWLNRRRYHLGSFSTPEAAYAAYCRASEDLHGEFANVG